MSLVNMQGKFIVKAGGAGGGGGISAPSNVVISNKSSSGFTVTWNAVANALGYKLDVATDSGFTTFVSGYNGKDVAGTSEAVTGLASNTTYYTRVRAVATGSNSGAVSDSTETVSATTFSSLGNGLQAFYKLDDTTDASGNGNTLTNNGGVTFSSGKIGNCAVLPALPLALEINNQTIGNFGSSDFTIAGWLNPSVVGGSQQSVLGLHNGASNTWGIYLRPDQTINIYGLTISSSNTVDFIGGGTVNANQWQHFVARRNGSTFEMFLNGTSVGSNTVTGSTGDNLPVYLGSDAVNAPFNGKLDAVGIWNRALTSGEIAELYNSGNGKEVSSLLGGLLAFYKLDDTTDASGNGNTLTNNGSVTFSSGKIGNAADFDGNSSKYLTSTSNLGQITGSGFSLSLWFKKTNGNNNVVAASGPGGNTHGWFLATNNDNNIYFLAGTGSGWATFDTAGTYSVDTWTHVVITSTSGGSVSYYVNGSLTTTNNSVAWTAAPLYIGKNIADGTSFGGQIDAVGIWNRPLNGTEVSELYNSGSGLE